ncbi:MULTISPECIES: hypothetical protein [Acetobacter]|uniref:hypothetical protein n=1 Tax=Acetobacter TaxID=434 RepID=UPI0039EB7CB6
MKKIALSLSLALLTTGQAFAQGVPFIDAAWQSQERQIQQAESNQCRGMGIMPRLRCRENVRNRYISQGVVPGTMPYVERHYGGMSVNELNSQIEKLNGLYGRVRMVGSFKPEVGEISYEMVQADINYIRQLINAKGGMPPLFNQNARGQ